MTRKLDPWGSYRAPFLLSLFFVCFVGPASYAADPDPLAELFSVQGSVESRISPATTFLSSSKGQSYRSEDGVRTGTKSRAGILFMDGVLVRLNELTDFEFATATVPTSGTQPVTVNSGEAYFFSREPRNFPQIQTPVVSAAVRGTEFVVRASQDEATISVLNGVVECSNQFGSVQLLAGEQAYTRRGQAPVKRIMVNPKDAVQWALYYPAILGPNDYPDFNEGLTQAQRSGMIALNERRFSDARIAFQGDDWRSVMGRSLAAYLSGDIPQAFSELSSFSGTKPPGFILYEANLNLAVGQVADAEKLLSDARALIESTHGPIAEKLRSTLAASETIVRLVNNDKESARTLAEAAVKADTTSASAALALSYVEQADFNLEKAAQWTTRATELAPENSLAHARQAEMTLGFGDLNQALVEADTAVSLNSEQVYAIIVKGFAELSQYKAEAAEATFRRAVEVDDAAGLPRLGLGLALIRNGDLENGRKEIEKAAYLEPSVALFRSYLGKAYFEEQRYNLANREFQLSKDLDPNDPTPYLYSAYAELAQFKPVSALGEIEGSIERNDNRAVYRSSFLLDQDRGSRSTSLARVFNSLEFYQAARIEAIKSINKDYSNYSAHLLLSDAYEGGSQFTQAEITENLISRVLAPVNFSFILPSPSGQASLNEYTSLFERPNSRTLYQGIARTGDDTLFQELIHAGTYNKFGYTLRYAPGYRHGYGANTDSSDHVFANTLYYQLSEQDTVSLFSSYSFSDSGDSGASFDPYAFDPDVDTEIDSAAISLGYRHQFQEGTNFIFTVRPTLTHRHTTDDFTNRSTLVDFTPPDLSDAISYTVVTNEDVRERYQGTKSEIQFTHDDEDISVITGGSFLKAEVDSYEDSPQVTDEFGVFDGQEFIGRGDHDEDAKEGFTYLTLHAGEWADLTAGVNYSDIEFGRYGFIPPFLEGEKSKSRWLPKFGATFYATDDLMLRTSYFENLASSGGSDLESIEPTLVGGLNQLYGDLIGAESRSYGVGMDWKSPAQTYIGTEVLRRKIIAPLPLNSSVFFLDTTAGTITDGGTLENAEDAHSEQYTMQSYLYQVLSQRFTTGLEHLWIIDENNFVSSEQRTHVARAKINYFDPSGWFGSTNVTWRNQEIKTFLVSDDPSFASDGDRDFWIWNIAAGYQLPNRHGTITCAVQNVIDQSYRYVQTNRDFAPVPETSVALAYSLNF